MKRNIKSMLPSELEDYFESAGQQKYRAKQVFSALHKGILSFDEITNLPVTLREKLAGEFYISSLKLMEKQISKDNITAKYLWQLEDNETAECVLVKYNHGTSLCISTQVGCKMGWIFCASSLDGFKRNLTASEMLDQILFTQMDLTPQVQGGQRIKNIVIMGIGEPLDNFDNLMRFIQLINCKNGLNIGARHITVSTSGIIENIDKLAEYDVQLTLAISLHAPDDDTRSYLMPSNTNTGVTALIKAGKRYFQKTGRRVTYEYAIIDGVNDSPAQAEILSKLIFNSSSHLNIILLNDIKESKLVPGSAGKVNKFTGILKKNGVNYTIRRSLGTDIDAACGQLRRRRLQKQE